MSNTISAIGTLLFLSFLLAVFLLIRVMITARHSLRAKAFTLPNLHMLLVLNQGKVAGHPIMKSKLEELYASYGLDLVTLPATLRKLRVYGFILEEPRLLDDQMRTYTITDEGRMVLQEQLHRMRGILEAFKDKSLPI